MLNLFKGKEKDLVKSYAPKSVFKTDLVNELGRGFWDHEIPIDTIMDKAHYIYNVLELENLDHYDPSCEGVQIEKTFLSSRQTTTMRLSLLTAMDGNIHESFHQLVDFIHNYGDELAQPVSNLERHCINQMLECIFYLFKKGKQH